MGRAHEVRAASMAKTAALKSKLYSRFGKELYIAAKSGVPDPDMNLSLKRKIAEAKSNQVPADVIKRAIDKAKGGSDESYDEARYEGFGPGNSTIIVDCLTDNTNRSYTNVKTAFNKSKGCKLAGAGAVSFGYENVGLFVFEYEDEEAMLDAMMEQDVDVQDAGDGRKKVVISGIAAKDLGNARTVVITAGNSKVTLKASPLSYANEMINTNDKASKDFATAIYKYWEAATNCAE